MKKKKPEFYNYYSVTGQEAMDNKHMKFHLTIRKLFFMVRVAGHRSLREVVGCPSLEIFKT